MRFSYCLLFIFSFALTSGCSTNSTTRLIVTGDASFLDTAQNLVWQQHKSRLVYSADEAQKYINKLNLSGNSGWRLPTLAEFHNVYFTFDFGEKSRKKSAFNLSGKFWVRNQLGEIVVGSWDDASGGCCIIREFTPAYKGHVKAVRASSQ